MKRVLKGISLPIETIVIIAIVILVLVVVSAFFMLESGKGFNTISHDAAWGQGCTILGTQKNCNPSEDLTKIMIPTYKNTQGKQKSLMDACIAKGFATTEDCRKSCGCY